MGVNLDNRALPGVYIGVIMGRHAGFLTAASAMAQQFPDDGPHLVYLPERTFDMDQFLADVKNVYDKYGRCIIAVSEGIQDGNGQPIITRFADQVEKDAHGNVQLSGSGALGDLLSKYIKDKLHIKRVRSDTFGYLQRSFMGCVSDVDQIEAREVGERAAQYAILHNLDGSVTIHRVGNYAVDYRLTDIKQIAALTKHMDDGFINKEGNHITEAFRAYCRPLLGSGLPVAGRLRSPMVEKLVK
jgi:6-phosphofructokinase 1